MSENCIMKYTPQWQEKIGRKLFPFTHQDCPDMPDAKDVNYIVTNIEFDWWDRLRILISGHVEVITKTASSVPICTKGTTVAQVNVKPPRYLQRLDTEKSNSRDSTPTEKAE